MVCLEWSAQSAALSGQNESGDACVIEEFSGGALLAAIDGLGHGSEAADVARIAASVLTKQCSASVDHLLERCHEALRGTRGVVLTVASIDVAAGVMHWVGIGDVQGVLLRGGSIDRVWVVNHGGVAGFQVPRIRASSVPIAVGDVLVLATDGIREDFADRLDARGPAAALAKRILDRSRKGSDDALVVVARYLGA